MSKNLAIIFAGGSGIRMGAGEPKQFLEVDGKPIIIHTLDIFENNHLIDEIYIACNEPYIQRLEKLVKRFDISKVRSIVPGGTTALGSAFNALVSAKTNNEDDAIVLIHDGVRPCITDALIGSVIEMASTKGPVVTCTPMFETPVISEGGEVVEDLPLRSNCYTAQAPQAFKLGEILAAHHETRKTNPEYEGIVDSCTLARRLGIKVNILKGPRSNIKVTTPEDLYIFKAMLEFKQSKDTFGVLTE